MDTDNRVPIEITREVIGKHLSEWRRELEGFRIAMEVAQVLDESEARKDQIRVGAERCVKAIEKLNSMLSELGEDGDGSTTAKA